jgi:hypothetical protein
VGIITAFVILFIDIILWLLPVQPAIEAFRTNELTNTFNNTATVSGNTTVTLSQELFNGNTALVAITTNNTADTPVVAAYDEATRVLSIQGLTPSATVVLTVNYFVDAFPNQIYWASVLNIAPYLFILILVILPVIAVVLFVQEMRRRAHG